MKKILLGLLIVLAASFATNVNNAHYTGSAAVPSIYFETDMQFTSDYTLQLVSGNVSSGDPDDLQTGDEVCSGATVRVVPTVSSKWATPDLSTVALYYTCYGGYCPPMSSYSTVNSNRNIAWLSSSTWNTQKTFGDSNDYSVLESDYNTLGVSNFYTEAVGYDNGSGSIYTNKEGGAGMFCKGTFQVTDGGTVKGSSAMPTVGNTEFALTTTGSHAISTQLSGVDCFPVVVKHPTNIPDNPAYFLMTYFTHGGPSIASTVATKTVTLTVGESGGECSFYDVSGSVSASSSLLDEDVLMLKATMHNSGDPVRITGVSSSNPDFTATAFPVAICDALGFPPSLCPGANGFNTDIASGANRDLYVLISRDASASGGTVLTFSGQTSAATCGSAATCSHAVDISGAVTCEVQPPSLDVDTNVVAEYTVTCENLAGDPVTCSGSDWTWDGIVGGFMEKTNTHAYAYATSPPGTSGTLNYHSGIAYCHSDVDVDENGIGSDFECEFIPASATMNVSTSKWFALNCFVNSTQDEPDDAEYDPVNGLAGSTSNSSTEGTTYTAPGSPDTGDLRGFASWSIMPDPMVGLVVFAPIIVVNGTSDGNDTNDTNNTDPDNPGSSKWCTIGSGPLTVYPGSHGWVGIMCGEHANETCTDVVWSTDGDVSLFDATTHGTEYTITGDPHATGRIQAYVNGDPTQACWVPFYISEPECWEYT